MRTPANVLSNMAGVSVCAFRRTAQAGPDTGHRVGYFRRPWYFHGQGLYRNTQGGWQLGQEPIMTCF
jgi:hypothetical protein